MYTMQCMAAAIQESMLCAVAAAHQENKHDCSVQLLQHIKKTNMTAAAHQENKTWNESDMANITGELLQHMLSRQTTMPKSPSICECIGGVWELQHACTNASMQLIARQLNST